MVEEVDLRLTTSKRQRTGHILDSNNWMIISTLSLPLFTVLLQLMWEHLGSETININHGGFAKGPLVPLALAW